jgi:hypothetical protein
VTLTCRRSFLSTRVMTSSAHFGWIRDKSRLGLQLVLGGVVRAGAGEVWSPPPAGQQSHCGSLHTGTELLGGPCGK